MKPQEGYFLKYLNFRTCQSLLGFSVYQNYHIMELVNEWFPDGKFRNIDTPFRTYNKYEKELMDALPFAGNSFISQKWNIVENLDILLEGYNTFILWVELTFVTQPVVYQPKLLHLLYLVSKVSNTVLNIWLVSHINPYVILIILIMDKISSGLHGVGIKLKTTKHRIV